MGRFGELYDQDAFVEPSAEKKRSRPVLPVLYDQDASMELPALDALALERLASGRRLVRIDSSPVAPPGQPPSAPPGGPRVPPGRPVVPSPGEPPPPPPGGPAPSPGDRPRPVPGGPAPSPGDRPRPVPGGRVGLGPGRGSRPARGGTGRAAAILAAGTFASRITGFVRVLVIGYVLGVDVLSDAFNYANGVPNIVYDLLVGGVLSATLVPVFVDQLRSTGRESSRSISAVFTAIGAALVAVSALLWLLAPEVIRFYLLLAPKATGPAERDLATRLLRLFAPQVFFLGATVASTALLNARRRFTAAAFSPVFNNVVAIAALIATKAVADRILTNSRLGPVGALTAFSRDERAVLVLGIGTTAGYALQLAAQLPAMARLGLRLRPVWDLRHPAVRRVASLSSWLLGVVLANQAALALVMILAGRTRGGVTAYQFAYQFFQLPYALIAVSVASAIMPDLAEHYSRGDRLAFERQLLRGLRTTLALVVPVGVLYMAVAQPLLSVAIHHGRVTASGAHLVATTLVFFAAGLPGFSAFFLLMRAFQAMQDARTMFRIYLLENGLTLVAAPVLSLLLGVPGLALAWVGPYTVASLYALAPLRRRVGPLGGWITVRSLVRVAIATAAAGGAALALGLPFGHRVGDVASLGRLLVQGGGGLAVYVWLARLLGVRELAPALASARRLGGRGGG